MPEAETASVYPTRDHDYHDPIMHMVHSALEESQEDDPDDSINMWTRLNISSPEEYSGSSDLKVYETFIAEKYQINDLVYLSTKNLTLPKHRARKLMPKFIGPYKILKAMNKSSNVTLELPQEFKDRKINPTFHTNLV